MFMTPKIQACHYVSVSSPVPTHSQTFENKSSAPPNPPAGFVALVTPPPPTPPPPPETGAALSQPPKSSSPDIVGAGFEGAPQPAPTSFAVRVSGTFIMEAGEGVATAPAGSGSGVLHALPPPPHGSMVEERMFAVTAGVDTLDGSGLGSGLGAGGGDELRLKADFISSWGDAMDMGGGGGGAAVVVGGGDERPKRSSEADGAGGCGLLCCGFCGGGCGGGDAKPVKPMSCPREENESLRD